MSIDTIEELRVARNESRKTLREVKKILGNEWKITFKARKKIVKRKANQVWWYIEGILAFKKSDIPSGFCWSRRPPTLSTGWV